MSDNYLKNFKEKVCVITGGAGIIGASLAECLSSAGMKVAILDVNKKQSEKTAGIITKKTSNKCIGVGADVLDKASLIKAKQIINKELGKIDFLINGAGGNHPDATTQTEEYKKDMHKLSFFGLNADCFKKVFDLNIIGTVLPSMVFAEDMVKKSKGVILNISSMNSFRPLTKIPAYSAAKASVNNFTQWLAVHFAKSGVRVNAIAPGFILTNQNHFLIMKKDGKTLTPRGEKIKANIPAGRLGKPADLNGTALYLLSDMSEFVTGVIIPVDGGYNAYGGV